jgi:hypothetical protein
MTQFIAIILVCMNSLPAEACTEETASDVMTIEAESELTCISDWQDVVARSALARDIGNTAYVRTICRRVPAPPRRS